MSLYQSYVEDIRSRAITGQPDEPIVWRSPSNIALVKYWGKHGDQLPMNPSISMTLSDAHTEMSVVAKPRAQAGMDVSLDFTFHGQIQSAFEARIKGFLTKHAALFPYTRSHHLSFKSENSFPHSAGIASSASAFSAMALCLIQLEDELYGGHLADDEVFRQKASFVARLASGSASRSIYQGWAWWGQDSELPIATDDYAIGVQSHVHPSYHGMRDSIVIVSDLEKPVSSSQGHAMMEHHPYREGRLAQARRHISELFTALRSGDLARFMHVTESEALSLHALMMSSYPGYRLMTAASWTVIDLIRDYRAETGTPVCFTLDAGPNVHVLYPLHVADQVEQFIQERLTPIAASIIYDKMGQGPQQL